MYFLKLDKYCSKFKRFHYKLKKISVLNVKQISLKVRKVPFFVKRTKDGALCYIKKYI